MGLRSALLHPLAATMLVASLLLSAIVALLPQLAPWSTRAAWPAMIGPSCHICEGATIDNSIIFDYSRIGPGVRLVEKLVFGRYCVDRNGDHFDLQEAALALLKREGADALNREGLSG